MSRLVNAEPTAYVFDSFAVLAYLQAEPGALTAKEILAKAERGHAEVYLAIVNYSEVLYIIERELGLAAAHQTIAAIDQLPIRVIEADRRLTFAAAHLKANHALSYADAFAAALAQQMHATVVTGDPEFRAMESLITVHWLPQERGEA
jgi:predicted nucleic acid-binding protein